MTEVLIAKTGRISGSRYTLLERLGAGGQGEVRRAHDETRGVDVALKVLSDSAASNEAGFSALQREYEITHRLDHPGILKVFPPERSGDGTVLPMELASGGDLRRLRGAGYLEIVPVLIEVAQALDHAHQRGVIHRDLKPGNILFDARGRVKLADFGVAGTVTADPEAANRGLSPFTASPEQLRGEPPNPADDIYGLGALAYELLSGNPPYFPHFDLRRAMTEPVSELVPTRQIPPPLAALIMRMLAKNAAERPRSMNEIIDELEASLNDTLTVEFDNATILLPTPVTEDPVAARAAARISTSDRAAPRIPTSDPGAARIPATDHAVRWKGAPAPNTQTSSVAAARAAFTAAPRPAAPAPPLASPRVTDPVTPPVAAPISAPPLPPSPPVPPLATVKADRWPSRAGARIEVEPPGPLDLPTQVEVVRKPANVAPDPALSTASTAESKARAARAAWEEIQMVAVPRVTRLEPIPPQRWPWVVVGLLVGIGFAAVYWLPTVAPDLIPSQFASLKPATAATQQSAADARQQQPADATPTPTSTPASTPPVTPIPPSARAPSTVLAATTAGAAAPTTSAIASAAPRALANSSASTEPHSAAGTTEPLPVRAAAKTDGRLGSRLRAARANFDNRTMLLEVRGAESWGAPEFSDAARLSAESIGAHDAGNDALALSRLADADRLLDRVEGKIPRALTAQLDAGNKAMVAGQPTVAARAYDAARLIDPDDARVIDAERKVRSAAVVSAASAPASVPVRAGPARPVSPPSDDGYSRAVGSGFAALGAGRLDEAQSDFAKARSYNPNGAEAAEGLRRVGAALAARGSATQRQRAAAFEAEERWDDAVREYEAALKTDSSLNYAQLGRARAGERADLANRLQDLIDRPERLATRSIRDQARSLLETARSETVAGPVLRSQIARLEILIPQFDRPERADRVERAVRLSLVSDNATQVAIPNIGAFGTFGHRDIDLKPGRYTVIGTRTGFREVRRDITVEPGQGAQTINVTCSDPI